MITTDPVTRRLIWVPAPGPDVPVFVPTATHAGRIPDGDTARQADTTEGIWIQARAGDCRWDGVTIDGTGLHAGQQRRFRIEGARAREIATMMGLV
jgi:hypothetical protein